MTIRTRMTLWYAGILLLTAMIVTGLSLQELHERHRQSREAEDHWEDVVEIMLMIGIPAALLSIGVWLAGSTGLIAMPSMPFDNRSSTTRCCSAAVPSAGMRNSTSMFGISAAAFSVPLRAIVQKSDALLDTKASLCLPPPAPGTPP